MLVGWRYDTTHKRICLYMHIAVFLHLIFVQSSHALCVLLRLQRCCCRSSRQFKVLIDLTQAREHSAWKVSPTKSRPLPTYLHISSPQATFPPPNLTFTPNTQPTHHLLTDKMESDVQEPTLSPSEHLLNRYLPLPYRVATLIVLGKPSSPPTTIGKKPYQTPTRKRPRRLTQTSPS